MSSPWQHPVRERLAQGEIVVAPTLVTPCIETAVQLATLGYHFLWVEMEHSPITLETLRLIVLATRGLPASVFARVPLTDLWMAKRVLDQGVSGVIFPFVSNPPLAQRAVAACRYPPLGKRGSGAGLATGTWPEPGNYYDSADRSVVTIAVIEDREGLESIEEIAATPGLDVIFIGTSDLSFSLGFRGDQNPPELHAAVDRIVAAAKRHGKFLGRPAGTPELIQQWKKQGFQFFQTGTELGLLASASAQILDPLGITGIPRDKRALY
jgi:2-keto-3-deoxy-L-rhamnonate aldolase RhmA